MCDTLVALKDATENGVTIFGKNSDRPPNEAQLVEFHPRAEYDEEAVLKCTHITVPQVRKTNAIVISRPFWMWGAEMGANEHGVVIGNEAVFSNEEVPETGLLGMDLIRLALERARTATDALEVIVALLEQYGQGGVCEYGGVMMYHNSFLIADKDTAWVLETSGKHWVAKKLSSTWAISNGYTIRASWDRASRDLIEFAVQQGWYNEDDEFDFAMVYGNEAMRYIARCDDRLSCTTRFLESKIGQLNFYEMCEILRNHPPDWTPWQQEMAAVCQHASHENSYATTGSQISELGESITHWFTGSSSPCMSVFWPFTFDDPQTYHEFDVGGEQYSADSYWWQREKVNRALSFRFGQAYLHYSNLVRELQKQVYENFYRGFERSRIAELVKDHKSRLKELAKQIEPDTEIPSEFEEYWEDRNKEVGLPVST